MSDVASVHVFDDKKIIVNALLSHIKKQNIEPFFFAVQDAFLKHAKELIQKTQIINANKGFSGLLWKVLTDKDALEDLIRKYKASHGSDEVVNFFENNDLDQLHHFVAGLRMALHKLSN